MLLRPALRCPNPSGQWIIQGSAGKSEGGSRTTETPSTGGKENPVFFGETDAVVGVWFLWLCEKADPR